MRQVLFLDDEPQVLDSLRDALRPQRREWRMRFLSSGDEALAALEDTAADVVVSDLRMPGMDGATFLAHVQDRWPDTVRIVLSGYAEAKAAVKAASVAHVVLGKPCPTDELRAAIDRCSSLRELIRSEIRDVAVGFSSLPATPDGYQELIAALAAPDATSASVAAVIQRDVALSAKVLQLANSAFFASGRRVTSIEQAVTDLGSETLKALALSTGAGEALAPQGVSLDEFAAHSLQVAGIARALATDPAGQHDAFTAGLLHDIGKLVLRDGDPSPHAEVGAHLLALWGIPQPVLEAVAHHHSPGRADDVARDAVLAVHVADVLAHEEAGTAPAAPFDADALASAGRDLDGERARAQAAPDGGGPA